MLYYAAAIILDSYCRDLCHPPNARMIISSGRLCLTCQKMSEPRLPATTRIDGVPSRRPSPLPLIPETNVTINCVLPLFRRRIPWMPMKNSRRKVSLKSKYGAVIHKLRSTVYAQHAPRGTTKVALKLSYLWIFSKYPL